MAVFSPSWAEQSYATPTNVTMSPKLGASLFLSYSAGFILKVSFLLSNCVDKYHDQGNLLNLSFQFQRMRAQGHNSTAANR